jgi:hypothetical protein
MNDVITKLFFTKFLVYRKFWEFMSLRKNLQKIEQICIMMVDEAKTTTHGQIFLQRMANKTD